jgi:hypothetical protein
VQRDLEAAAERCAVDEPERRDAKLPQSPEYRVAERRDPQRSLPGLRGVCASRGERRRRAVQVRAGTEDERLAGHADGGDLAALDALGDAVQGGVQG